ncbi:MAG: hypothetical protein R6V85_17730 [Polyangia bacterium]
MSSAGFAGADIDLGDAGGESGLELAVDPRAAEPSPVDAGLDTAPAEPDGPREGSDTREPPLGDFPEMEVRAASGFGSPVEGLRGTLRYGWCVYRRRRELARELGQALEERREAELGLLESRAALGRRVPRVLDGNPELDEAVGLALRADGEVSGAARRCERIDADRQRELGGLDRKAGELEAERRALESKREQAEDLFDRADTDHRRAAAVLDRAEIELRNLRELIERRQKDYADLERPDEERRRLLDEIARYDKQQSPVIERIKTAREEVRRLEEPASRARERVAGAREELERCRRRISELQRERRHGERRFDKELESASAELEGEAHQASEAWAAVGDLAGGADLRGTPAEPAANRVAAARERFGGAARREALLARARDSHDARAYRKAELTAAALAAGLLALVVATIVLLS